MPQIVALAVGRDPLLLQTRSQVLRSAGYTVVTALSLDQSLKEFRGGDFDLVILCHSIPQPERELFTNAVHSHSPKTPVIVISATLSSMDRFADAMVENEPAVLLQEIPRVLHRAPESYPYDYKEA
jgi:DNA-binding response OmpR family regulator